MDLTRRSSKSLSPRQFRRGSYLAAMTEWTSLGQRADSTRRLSRLRTRHAYNVESVTGVSPAVSADDQKDTPVADSQPITPETRSTQLPERAAARRELRKRRCTNAR